MKDLVKTIQLAYLLVKSFIFYFKLSELNRGTCLMVPYIGRNEMFNLTLNLLEFKITESLVIHRNVKYKYT